MKHSAFRKLTLRFRLAFKPYHKTKRSSFFDKPEEFNLTVDSGVEDVSNPAWIERRSELRWGEHCVQCAAPECHATCDMYLPRDEEGRCRRFQYGIRKTKKFSVLKDHAHDIVFLPWSNLLASVTEPVNVYDGFLLRIHNPNRKPVPFLFYLKNRKGAIRFMVRETAHPGPCQFFFPMGELTRHIPIEQFGNVFIAPDVRDRTRLYFEFHDFVTFSPAFMSDAGFGCVVFELDDLCRRGDDGVISVDEQMLIYLRLFLGKDVAVIALTDGDPDEALEALESQGIDDLTVFGARPGESRADTLTRLSRSTGRALQTFAYLGASSARRDQVKRAHARATVMKTESVFLLLFALYDRRELAGIFERREKTSRAAKVREQKEASFDGTRAEFLRDSETVVGIEAPQDSHLDSVQEIVQLSNRLNYSNHRYSRREIATFFRDRHRHLCRVVTARDRFGDYGIVGFFIVDTGEAERWIIKDLMISCYVFGRDIDLAVLTHILESAVEHGVRRVDLFLSLNSMNQSAKDAVERCGFDHERSGTQGVHYGFDLSNGTPPKIDYITLVASSPDPQTVSAQPSTGKTGHRVRGGS